MDLRRDRKRSLKFREMLETQEYAQAQDAKKEETNRSPVKEKVYIKMCVINVRSLISSIYMTLLVTIFLSKPYRKCQSEPTDDAEVRRKKDAAAKCQTESTDDAEVRRKKDAEAHAAKQQSESTQGAEVRRKEDAEAHAAKRQTESTQEAEARRKKDAEAHAAKHQAESTQETEARRKREA